jgi:hypothetical protein
MYCSGAPSVLPSGCSSAFGEKSGICLPYLEVVSCKEASFARTAIRGEPGEDANAWHAGSRHGLNIFRPPSKVNLSKNQEHCIAAFQ